MKLTIISVGSKPDALQQTLLSTYSKRLPDRYEIIWRFVKHAGGGEPSITVAKESEEILRSLPRGSRIILFDERGRSVSSPDFAELVFADLSDTTFIIGGAYGVSKAVRDAADTIISLSGLTLPHQMVRHILLEQLYRGYTIVSGHPYHHA